MLAPCLPLLLALAASAPDPSAPPGAGAPAAPVVPAAPAAAPEESVAVGAPTAAPADVSTAPAPVAVPAPVSGDMSVGTVPAPTAVSKSPVERGPFFVGEPASDTAFPNGPRPTDPPRFSLGRGAFCFVDDTFCKSSLILTADVGIGVNVITGPGGTDRPYAQYQFRGGLVLKPLLRHGTGDWHPWGIGVVGSWSRGTGQPSSNPDRASTHTDAWRVALVNQLWLSKKRNGFHLDLDLGVVRSNVRASEAKYFGTHAAVSANFGGVGGLFVATDLLEHDTRVVFGFRGHGVATAPLIGLVLLGLLVGGAL